MTKYVALLRGIGPTNPNMRGEKLRAVFEKLGFKNVATVIASGNVIFESSSKDIKALETKIETAFPRMLGFTSTTIIRSQKEIESLLKKDPFKKIPDEKHFYPIITFIKGKRGEIATALDRRDTTTPDFMRTLEKKHGKAITTRTWKTIGRIHKKML